MRIGFTGTQHGMSLAQATELRLLLLQHTGTFHHGDCIGADAEAHDIAVFCGLSPVIHAPHNSSKRAWRKAETILPPRTYLARNRDIVDHTELLIATPEKQREQLRSGTWSTIRYARKIGRVVLIIKPNGIVSREPAEKLTHRVINETQQSTPNT